MCSVERTPEDANATTSATERTFRGQSSHLRVRNGIAYYRLGPAGKMAENDQEIHMDNAIVAYGVPAKHRKFVRRYAYRRASKNG